ncbi:MAG TPA: MFS transporter [Candidatus Limnocylindrales bacterium]|nr:MFS transporter [Candidatus Limnocylindrales bacterium]
MTHGPSTPETEASAPPAVAPAIDSFTDHVGGLWSPARRSLTVGLVVTVTLVAFEALAIATILPIVTRELGDLHLYGWVFSAFFLGTLLGTVLLGGMADRRGLVLPFALGLGLFAVGLVAGGLAPSMLILVIGRFVQGLGAGAIAPIAYVAIGRTLPEALRAQMFAVLSTAWVLPGLIGPAIAGLIGEATSWRVVFLGLLPLIAVSGALTVSALGRIPEAVRATDSGSSSGSGVPDGHRVRWAFVIVGGAALATAGLTSVSLLPGLPLIGVGLVLTVRAFMALTPSGTLRAAAGLPAAVLLRGVLTFAFFAADAYVPLALQDWRGTSASVSGIALTAATLSWTAGAWIQARGIARFGARRFVRLGFATVALGIVGFAAVLSPAVPIFVGIAAWAVAGLGMGLAYSTLSLVTLREARVEEQGAASAALQLSDVLGTALGTGVGGALIAAGLVLGAEAWWGLAAAFAVGAAIDVLGVALSGRLPGRLRADGVPTPA